jgi:large conductance mechanosensitive channel
MTVETDFNRFMRTYAWSVGVGVVIGAVLNDFIFALINDILMPLLAMFTGIEELEGWTVKIGDGELLMGHFLSTFIYFIIVALILFLLVRYIIGIKRFRG